MEISQQLTRNICISWYNRCMENTIIEFVNNNPLVSDYLKSYVVEELKYLKNNNPAATLEELLQQAMDEAREVWVCNWEDEVYNY